MRGRKLLEEALLDHGILDPARMESHIRGCDLRRAVVSTTLDVGYSFSVWVRDGGVPGKYGADVNEDPSKLGIIVDGRHKETFVVRRILNVVSCTAASFPIGFVNEVGGKGGGKQYLLPPDWLRFVERIA